MAHESELQRSGAWDPIAYSVKTLIDSYLGKRYRNKRGATTLHPFWRWLNATFGAALVLTAVYLRTIVTVLSPDVSEEFGNIVGKLSANLETAIPIVASLTGMLIGIVAATSIRHGGPVRLFIAGVFLSALPFALSIPRTS